MRKCSLPSNEPAGSLQCVLLPHVPEGGRGVVHGLGPLSDRERCLVPTAGNFRSLQ